MYGMKLVRSVRLVGGSSSRGRLEVLHNGIWGTVCGDFFSAATAHLVCTMLGFRCVTTVSIRVYLHAYDLRQYNKTATILYSWIVMATPKVNSKK